jgi:hypothetical protein
MDILNRINVRDLYPQDSSWTSAVAQAKYNLQNIPDKLKPILSKFPDPETDNDTVALSHLGKSILIASGVKNLYWFDNWELLGCNMEIIDLDLKSPDYTLVNIQDGFNNDKHWTNSVKSAKNILSKTPPKAFIDKWRLIGDEKFRNRMKQSDNNSAIAVNIAMNLGQGKPCTTLYDTDDWELLINNINIMTSNL